MKFSFIVLVLISYTGFGQNSEVRTDSEVEQAEESGMTNGSNRLQSISTLNSTETDWSPALQV